MSEQPSSDELLPCPFCGSKDAQLGGEWSYGFYVCCNSVDCYCALGEGYDRDAMPSHGFRTEPEAIAAWNQRASK